MSVFNSIKIPEFDVERTDNKRYFKSIQNYLIMLDENIRYAIENIDDENITKQFIDDLTVQHLLVTNGDNSIIVNPEAGLQMRKGNKSQLKFNIATGEAEFGGRIIGSEIVGSEILGSLFRSNTYSNEPDEAYMILTSGNLCFYADGGVLFLKASHSGIEGVDPSGYGYGNIKRLKITPLNSTLEISTVDADHIKEEGVSLKNKYAAKSHSHSNLSFSFNTVDGKIVTVTNGIITAVQ